MENFSTLQLVLGTFGVMSVVISATFAGYWNIFGKKNRTLSKREIPRSVNSRMRQAQASYQQ